MANRQRIRVGREVAYNPTAAEATANGAGPWHGQIVAVNANSTVDVSVVPTSVPAPTAVAAVVADAAVAATADADDVTSPDGSDAGTTQTLANEIKADYNLAEPLINEIKANYNLSVALVNELKGELNASIVDGARLGSFRISGVSQGEGAGTFSLLVAAA